MAPRPPQDIPLPPSPIANQKSQQRTVKGKERDPGLNTKNVDQEQAWEWTPLTDASVSRQRPIFTKDGLYFFAIAGSSVKIYATATGEIVSTLSPPSTTPNEPRSPDIISCATLNPQNSFQLITGSLNGTIAIWDFLDAKLLQSINVTYPIHHMCAHESFKNTVFISAIRPTTKSKRQDDNGVVLRVSLTPSEATEDGGLHSSSSVIVIGKTRAAMGLTISSSGKWLVAVAGHKAYVSLLSNPSAGFTKYVSPEWLTCVAFHPTEEYFATGDEKGIIRLWYCLDGHTPASAPGVEKKAQTTTFHWHAHTVSSLSFTANGAYLLSGGEEAVLVIWQLQTGKKEFVPRLGAPISTVTLSPSPSSEEYLIGLSDFTFVFVNSATLKISRSYARIKLDPVLTAAASWAPTPLATHSLNSTLILPSSHQSSLQVCSPSAHKLVTEIEVSPSNRVSRRDYKPVIPARVERVAISPCGKWMATVDVRDGDEAFQSDIYLKFWSWDTASSLWILNTRIDRPHGKGLVSSMSFRPSCKGSTTLWFVTSGEDGGLKTWRIRANKRKGGLEEYWVTRSRVTFKSAVPIFATWSPDGSALAVSFGAFVVIYDPDTSIASQTMSFSECTHIVTCEFVGAGGRYLACKGVHDLLLWDLIARRVRWHYHTHLALSWIIPHPFNGSFVVFHSFPSQPATKAVVFFPHSQIPTETHDLPFALRSVVWQPTSSSGSMGYSFVGITHSWNVVGIAEAAKLLSIPEPNTQNLPSNIATSATIFQDIFGTSAFTTPLIMTDPVTSVESRIPWRNKNSPDALEGPTYLVPPISDLFESLVAPFLRTRAEQPVIHPVVVDDGDIEMEDEVNNPIVKAKSIRRVDEAEMNSLITLFTQQAFNPPEPPTNGVKKTKSTDISRKKGFASQPRVETPKRFSPTTSTSTIDSPVASSGSSRKRKATS